MDPCSASGLEEPEACPLDPNLRGRAERGNPMAREAIRKDGSACYQAKGPDAPVSKHGPRSLTRMRVFWSERPRGKPRTRLETMQKCTAVNPSKGATAVQWCIPPGPEFTR